MQNLCGSAVNKKPNVLLPINVLFFYRRGTEKKCTNGTEIILISIFLFTKIKKRSLKYAIVQNLCGSAVNKKPNVLLPINVLFFYRRGTEKKCTNGTEIILISIFLFRRLKNDP